MNVLIVKVNVHECKQHGKLAKITRILFSIRNFYFRKNHKAKNQ